MMLYMLGYGPAACLETKFPVAQPILVRLYGPMTRAIMGTPLETPFIAYMEWCLGLIGEQ